MKGHSGIEAGSVYIDTITLVWALVIVGKASDIKLQKLFGLVWFGFVHLCPVRNVWSPENTVAVH